MSEVLVRGYREGDRVEVEAICVETGLGGRLSEYFSDGELFAKLWLSPFLDGEPESCVVAEREGRVIGYLVGSVKKGFRGRAVRANLWWLFLMAWRMITRKYVGKDLEFVKWVLLRSWREAPGSPEGYGNFHFNVRGEERGEAGTLLVNRFMDRLREVACAGFYVHVILRDGGRGWKFYRRMGFRWWQIKECSLFGDGQAAFACFVRKTPVGSAFSGEIDRDETQIGGMVVAGDGMNREMVEERLRAVERGWRACDKLVVVVTGECDQDVYELGDDMVVDIRGKESEFDLGTDYVAVWEPEDAIGRLDVARVACAARKLEK